MGELIAGESAGGNDTVDMGMQLDFLIPGMEHAEETDLGAEMSGVASDFEKSFGAGPKQQTIDDFLVLQSQRSQFETMCFRRGMDQQRSTIAFTPTTRS